MAITGLVFQRPVLIIHHQTGKLLNNWGSNLFVIPHGLTVDKESNIWVTDIGLHQAYFTSVAFDPVEYKIYTIDELSFIKIKHRGSDIIISDTNGVVLSRFGRSSNDQPGATWFHDIVIDNKLNIFFGDILNNRILKFEKTSNR